jgi:CHRD domain
MWGRSLRRAPAGDFDALVKVIETLSAYVNVHTTNFPAGEIRGQIRPADEQDDEQGDKR